jgi:hypothetical protein
MDKRRRKAPPKKITPATMPLWPDAGQLLGISRGATYLAAQRGDIKTIRIGGRVLALIKPLYQQLGLDGDAA